MVNRFASWPVSQLTSWPVGGFGEPANWRTGRPANRRGFTLIELLVAVSISMVIMGAVFFSLSAALESWHYSRDELALQQTMAEVLDEVQEGTDARFGVRAALEFTEAYEERLSFVRPWTETRQASGGSQESFRLEQYVKPGSGLPSAEVRLPDTDVIRALPLAWEDPDNIANRPYVRPGFELIPGSTVTLGYHPDPERSPEAVVTVGWDSENQLLYWETLEGREVIGQNPFGVKVTGCRFRYFDPSNTPIVERGDVPWRDLSLITAVEVELTGQLGNHELTLPGMVMLRNSMRHSGLVILREGMRVLMPNSRQIETFLLTNLTGITHGDEIELEVRPSAGRAWRVRIRFEQYGELRPVIAEVAVEYPSGHPLFTARPRLNVDPGLDFLTIGPNGLYDYDDDAEINDFVLVEGDSVELKVTKMDIGGAACFVQP